VNGMTGQPDRGGTAPLPREPVAVVATGVANVASVLAAWRRLGVPAHLTRDPAEVLEAARVQLPGVGSFGAAMEALRRDGLDEAIRSRIALGRPTLAICVGLQVLAESSEESPGVRGLGGLPGVVRRFPDTVRVPQFGWNSVEVPEGDLPDGAPVESGYAYFANSFRLAEAPEGWHRALADHGGPFGAALWRKAGLATQFHPELSGPYGLRLMARFASLPADGRTPW